MKTKKIYFNHKIVKIAVISINVLIAFICFVLIIFGLFFINPTSWAGVKRTVIYACDIKAAIVFCLLAYILPLISNYLISKLVLRKRKITYKWTVIPLIFELAGISILIINFLYTNKIISWMQSCEWR